MMAFALYLIGALSLAVAGWLFWIWAQSEPIFSITLTLSVAVTVAVGGVLVLCFGRVLQLLQSILKILRANGTVGRAAPTAKPGATIADDTWAPPLSPTGEAPQGNPMRVVRQSRYKAFMIDELANGGYIVRSESGHPRRFENKQALEAFLTRR